MWSFFMIIIIKLRKNTEKKKWTPAVPEQQPRRLQIHNAAYPLDG